MFPTKPFVRPAMVVEPLEMRPAPKPMVVPVALPYETGVNGNAATFADVR